jgi:coproporphyrinogen III oxidase-like Fe-S oxidoreductase
MTAATRPGEAMEALRCRDDILQAMFWLRGEDAGRGPDLATLGRLLVSDLDVVGAQLAILDADGLVRADGDHFHLTDAGVREGGRRFADEFADLTKAAHGDCPPNCPHCADLPRDACDHCAGSLLDGPDRLAG